MSIGERREQRPYRYWLHSIPAYPSQPMNSRPYEIDSSKGDFRVFIASSNELLRVGASAPAA